MATSRFFVANLPPDTKELDISKLFEDYGKVTKIEIKTKENLVDPENIKTIAFVTLIINATDVEYCLNELNWHKIKGYQIKVALAKESFLERLKRERQESEAAVSVPDNASSINEHNASLLTENKANTRKKFSDDFEYNGDDDVSHELIIKKTASRSLCNGKITIQGADLTPIHVIKSKQDLRQLDAKSTAADRKRQQSLNQKKIQYQQNKSLIQQALTSENGSASKKIRFSASELDVANATPQTNLLPKKNIFGSDEDEDGSSCNMKLDLKPQHFGKKGEMLLQLQRNQNLDPRFKIDEKFANAEFDKDDNDENIEKPDDNNERDWQIGILEQVVGTKMNTVSTNYPSKNKKMLRFDPLKNEHRRFLRNEEENVPVEATTKKSKTVYPQDNHTGDGSTEVSKEVFYMVSDSLSRSLKTRGDGFSLLNMFGDTGLQTEEQREDNLKKVTHEKILFNRVDKSILNPFSYDSSSFDSDEDIQLNAEDSSHNHTQKKGKSKGKVKFVGESFFIPRNDARLKEGAKFFCYKKVESSENYDEVRNQLKQLIKRKITKSKQKFLSGRRKGKSKYVH